MMTNVSMNLNRLDNDKRLDDDERLEERGSTFSTARSSRIVSMMTNVSMKSVAALLARLGPLERWQRRLKQLLRP